LVEVKINDIDMVDCQTGYGFIPLKIMPFIYGRRRQNIVIELLLPFSERSFFPRLNITVIANKIPLSGIWHNFCVPKNPFQY
jgi:hypothetical protein